MEARNTCASRRGKPR